MSSISGHKTQGSTLDSAIVGSWGRYKYGAKGWLYTILSRVPNLNNLYILKEIPTDPKKFKSRTMVLLEHQRIGRMAQKTMNKIEKFI